MDLHSCLENFETSAKRTAVLSLSLLSFIDQCLILLACQTQLTGRNRPKQSAMYISCSTDVSWCVLYQFHRRRNISSICRCVNFYRCYYPMNQINKRSNKSLLPLDLLLSKRTFIHNELLSTRSMDATKNLNNDSFMIDHIVLCIFRAIFGFS